MVDPRCQSSAKDDDKGDDDNEGDDDEDNTNVSLNVQSRRRQFMEDIALLCSTAVSDAVHAEVASLYHTIMPFLLWGCSETFERFLSRAALLGELGQVCFNPDTDTANTFQVLFGGSGHYKVLRDLLSFVDAELDRCLRGAADAVDDEQIEDGSRVFGVPRDNLQLAVLWEHYAPVDHMLGGRGETGQPSAPVGIVIR